MKHKVICSLAVCVLLVAISMQGSANPVAYTITDLGTLGGGESGASDINDRGQVVGWAQIRTGKDSAFMYDGTMHELGGLYDINDKYARGINENGQVVGSEHWSHNGPKSEAFMYDGTTHDLGGFRNENVAYDINDSGQAVGYSGWIAFLYDGTMHDLGYLGGYTGSSYARGINNSGQVVGWASTSSGATHAFLYDGTMQDLGTLPGGKSSYACGINESGQVAGYSKPGSGNEHAFLYDDTMHDLGTLYDGYDTHAGGINDCGQVVGTAWDSNDRGFAWVWQNGAMIDLNTAVELDDYWSYLGGASAINNAGQIVGNGYLKNGQRRAYLLTPVPEPSSLLALVAGLGGLGILYRRRK